MTFSITWKLLRWFIARSFYRSPDILPSPLLLLPLFLQQMGLLHGLYLYKVMVIVEWRPCCSTQITEQIWFNKRNIYWLLELNVIQSQQLNDRHSSLEISSISPVSKNFNVNNFASVKWSHPSLYLDISISETVFLIFCLSHLLQSTFNPIQFNPFVSMFVCSNVVAVTTRNCMCMCMCVCSCVFECVSLVVYTRRGFILRKKKLNEKKSDSVIHILVCASILVLFISMLLHHFCNSMIKCCSAVSQLFRSLEYIT